MSRKAVDMKDAVFGRLRVIRRVENQGDRTSWECICECGNIKITTRNALQKGQIQSCGCLKSEMTFWTSEAKQALREAWAEGLSNEEIILRIWPTGPAPTTRSLSDEATRMGLGRRKLAPKPKPKPVFRVVEEDDAYEPMSIEEAMAKARAMIAKHNDLSDLNAIEIAHESGLTRFVAQRNLSHVTRLVRTAIGQVRQQRYAQ